jgi:DNA-binding transcriptional ArsR family regulator
MQRQLQIEVSESLIFEVALLLSMTAGYLPESFLPEPCIDFIAKMNKARASKLCKFLGREKTMEQLELLTIMAFAGDCLFAVDAKALMKGLERATLLGLARQIGVEGTLRNKKQLKENVVTALFDFDMAYSRLVGAPERDAKDLRLQTQGDIERFVMACEPGKQRDEFLHEMRMFLEGEYLPWRETRMHIMSKESNQVVAALKGNRDVLKDRIAWLADRHASAANSGFMTAVQMLKLRVVVVPTPFGMFDFSWALPGLLFASAHAKSEAIGFFAKKMELLSARLKALSDPTRLLMLRFIRQRPAHAAHLARSLGLARPTISVHASILEQAGLIKTRSEGRKTILEIQPEAVWTLLDDLERSLDVQRK